MTNAIVCNKAIVHMGCIVTCGCILSFGVEVGPDLALKENSRLTAVGKKQNIDNIPNGNIWSYENGKLS